MVFHGVNGVRDEAEKHLHWQLGHGGCDFWLDSWLKIGPLADFYPNQRGGIKVNQVWHQGKWQNQYYKHLLTHEHVAMIENTLFDPDMEDKLLWKLSQVGLFSFKHTYEDIREKRPLSPIYSAMWHQTIARKIFFLAWRLLQRWLPVDDVMQSKGINMASRCNCCNQVLTVWSLSLQVKGHIRQVLPLFILWGLWEGRNKARHLKIPYTFHSIKARILYLLAANARANMMAPKFWKGEFILANLLRVTVRTPPAIKVKILSWDKPLAQTLRLNVDAAFKVGKSGYGGLIRDHNGDLYYAVRKYATNDSPLEAELDALLFCLQVCKIKGLYGIQVEMDSSMVVKMKTHMMAHWRLHNKLSQVLSIFKSLGATIEHIYREKNLAGDWIAGNSMRNEQNFVWEAATADHAMQRLVLLEINEH
ncbi:hypothetical protein LIER_27640 [Lithospermum erythrorhizon]|uniref:RNase H type-1 domain-containing protein n=1 Tax=Lithospermum erythrorhizon TaxID=34254 RepID=A0AAV3RGV6_LITER